MLNGSFFFWMKTCTYSDLFERLNAYSRVIINRSFRMTQSTPTHCNTLQHTATHCNTLQHTAKHYNTLQHTATDLFEWLCTYSDLFERLYAYTRMIINRSFRMTQSTPTKPVFANKYLCMHTYDHLYMHISLWLSTDLFEWPSLRQQAGLRQYTVRCKGIDPWSRGYHQATGLRHI